MKKTSLIIVISILSSIFFFILIAKDYNPTSLNNDENLFDFFIKRIVYVLGFKWDNKRIVEADAKGYLVIKDKDFDDSGYILFSLQ